MNNLILSAIIFIVFLFHTAARSYIRSGKVKESFCALWCIDAVFAICGTLISFAIYQYDPAPFFSWRNLLFLILYLLATVLFMMFTPSGFKLLIPTRPISTEELLQAEYRYNDTLCMVRDFFMLLLFLLPICLNITSLIEVPLSSLFYWSETDIWGCFCFVAFLILVPICLRQALFWLKSLQSTPEAPEAQLQLHYRTQLRLKKKNRRM